jgi:hypothetical protein
MFACLAAAAPPAADQRMERDRHIPASKAWKGKYSGHLLETIDWCLRLDHLERPQSVLELQKVLLRERDPVVAVMPAAAGLRGAIRKLTGWRGKD